jgi:hypothetical protein
MDVLCGGMLFLDITAQEVIRPIDEDTSMDILFCGNDIVLSDTRERASVTDTFAYS